VLVGGGGGWARGGDLCAKRLRDASLTLSEPRWPWGSGVHQGVYGGFAANSHTWRRVRLLGHRDVCLPRLMCTAIAQIHFFSQFRWERAVVPTGPKARASTSHHETDT